MSSVRSRNSTVCLAVQATVLAAAALSLILTLALRPYRAPADLGHAIFVGVTTVVAGCLSIVDVTRPYASTVASAALASAWARIFLVLSVLIIQRLPVVRNTLHQKVAQLAQAPKRRQTFVANAAAPLLVVEASGYAGDNPPGILHSKQNRVLVVDDDVGDQGATKCHRPARVETRTIIGSDLLHDLLSDNSTILQTAPLHVIDPSTVAVNPLEGFVDRPVVGTSHAADDAISDDLDAMLDRLLRPQAPPGHE